MTDSMTLSDSYVHVAVAVIRNEKNEILISRRNPQQDLANLWEFPGGKLEDKETVQQALQRELLEEVGIRILSISPLIKIPHHYAHKSVLLDVWLVESFDGEARGLEGQEITWCEQSKLVNYEFPAADNGIITALELPSLYVISPDPVELEQSIFLNRLEQILRQDCKLFRLRSKHDLHKIRPGLIDEVSKLCGDYESQLMLDARSYNNFDIEHCGVHIDSKALFSFKDRPYAKEILLAASCHNYHELEQAVKIGVDFICLGSVLETESHPHASPMGWQLFRELAEQCSVPAYAIGGMSPKQISQARENGAQGIAAIRSVWND